MTAILKISVARDYFSKVSHNYGCLLGNKPLHIQPYILTSQENGTSCQSRTQLNKFVLVRESISVKPCK